MPVSEAKGTTMRQFIPLIFAAAPAVALGQNFNDTLVQSPELSAPQRGSIAGKLGGFRPNEGALSRGGFSLPSPLTFPDELGAPLTSLSPTYSVQSGLSEWGMGWSLDLKIRRFREQGSIDYSSTDQYTSPWGKLLQGSDGAWYPAGFDPLIRLQKLPGLWLAEDGQGTRWRFEEVQTTASGDYAWYLTLVENALGARTELNYTTNSSGRPFLQEVSYGSAQTSSAHRILYQYASLPSPFWDYRSGERNELDRRLERITAQIREGGVGPFKDRWTYDLAYVQSSSGPAFYLASVRRTFASGEKEPPIVYGYDIAGTELTGAQFAQVPGLDPYLQALGSTSIQPTRATLTDLDRDGRIDLEFHEDFRVYRHTNAGWQWESHAPSASPHPACWPTFGAANPPRKLMRVLPGQQAPQVLAQEYLFGVSMTSMVLCERDGQEVNTVDIPGDWRTGPTTRVVDLDRDQRPDLLKVGAGFYEVIPNESTPSALQFGAPITGALSPAFTPNAAWLQDLNGDGIVDLVVRGGASLVLYAGLGGHRFESVGQTLTLSLTSGTPFIAWSQYGLSFVDANRDGLTDILMSNALSAILFTNRLTHFAQIDVPGFSAMGGNLRDPVIADVNGSGEAEIIATVGLNAYALKLTQPSTGLLINVDDGRGTWLGFSYDRAPAVEGVEQRPVVLAEIVDSAIGADWVSTSYAYTSPRIHSKSRRFLGFERVDQSNLVESQSHEFKHTDAVQGLPLRSERRDSNTPNLYTFQESLYAPRVHLGLSYDRQEAQRSGYGRDSDGFQISADINYEAFDREFCATRARSKTTTGELIETAVLASPSALVPELHCLTAEMGLEGKHAASHLDFSESRRITRNAQGQIQRLERLAAAGTRLEQEVVYDGFGRITSLLAPKSGLVSFDYDPVSGALVAVNKPNGVRVEVSARDPRTQRPTIMSTLRGSGSGFVQEFAFDGRERLEASWNNADGSSQSEPARTLSYQEPSLTLSQLGVIGDKTRFEPGSYYASHTFISARGHTLGTGLEVGPDLVLENVSIAFASVNSVWGFSAGHISSAPPAGQVSLGHLINSGNVVGVTDTDAFGQTSRSWTAYDAQTNSETITAKQLTAVGLEITTTDRSGASSVVLKAANGVVLQSTDPNGETTLHLHDAAGRLRSTELPSGQLQTVDFNEYGDPKTIEQTIAGTLHFEHDSAGRVQKATLTDSAYAPLRWTENLYDSAGRIEKQTHEDALGNQSEFQFAYDGIGTSAVGQLGRLSRVIGPGFERTHVYRVNDQLSKETWTFPGWRTIDLELHHRKDGSVERTTRTIRDASSQAILETVELRYPVDASGRMSGLELNGTPIYNLSYRADGQLDQVQLTTGETMTWHYDGFSGRVQGYDKISGGQLSETHWSWNQRGLVDHQQLTVQGQLQSDVTFDYDPRAFLVQADDAAQMTEQWSYDQDGRVSLSDDRLGARPSNWAGTTRMVGGHEYEYDDIGRVIRRDDLEMSYGPHGHLDRVTDLVTGDSTTFEYDEKGERILKTGPAGQRTALIDEGQLTATGWTERIQIGGHTIGLVRGGVFEPVFSDPRSSMVEDSTGAFEGLSPYGARTARSADHEVLDYNNEGYNTELGTIRFGVRDYDPLLGEFLTPDPLFFSEPGRCVQSPTECNLYVYSLNNPVLFSDPTGTSALMDSLYDIGQTISHGADNVARTVRGWDVSGHVGSFAGGFVQGATGAPANAIRGHDITHTVGQIAGATSGLVVDVILIQEGGTVAGGGVIACATGAGCAVGAPAAAAGAVAVVAGTYGVTQIHGPQLVGGVLDLSDKLDNIVFRRGKGKRGALKASKGHSSKGSKSKSNKQKHENGDARRAKDRGGEKADKKRSLPRKKPKGRKGGWPKSNSKKKK